YSMAHKPLKMTVNETHQELQHAWEASYSAQRNAEAIRSLGHKNVGPRVFHFIMRLGFRAIYFPQTTKRAWLKVIWQNRQTVMLLTREALKSLRKPKTTTKNQDPQATVSRQAAA